MITNTVSSVASIIRGLVDDKLRTDGRDSFIYESDNVFTLTEDFPSSSTIKVFQNGTELSSGDFSYDADTNQVTISASLSANDTIIITYHYYKKYSEAEIKGYLESSLAYFPQYQYKKTFEVDENDLIVAINNYDPTTEELYFIATIASIVIDPQNIRVTIPDLGISPKRDLSDQDQIKISFRNFKNFIGAINFEELKI
jgi:hypothetical protein